MKTISLKLDDKFFMSLKIMLVENSSIVFFCHNYFKNCDTFKAHCYLIILYL